MSALQIIVLIIQVICSLALIAIVLLQSGKSAGLSGWLRKPVVIVLKITYSIWVLSQDQNQLRRLPGNPTGAVVTTSRRPGILPR